MITYNIAANDTNLVEIIELQKANLKERLSKTEILREGFVTVTHSLTDLQNMDGYEKSLLMKDDNKTVGYLLAMTKNSEADIPVLVPMFETFEKILYKGKLLNEYRYIVVGQVCIEKNYRGQGLLGNAYNAYKNHFSKKYQLAITEIATENQRSINAHRKIGFKEIHRFTDINQIEWSIVLWDWVSI